MVTSGSLACILDWICGSDEINRLSMAELGEAYSGSPLALLQATVRREPVPDNLWPALRERMGGAVDFGVSGVWYVLAKRKRLRCG